VIFTQELDTGKLLGKSNRALTTQNGGGAVVQIHVQAELEHVDLRVEGILRIVKVLPMCMVVVLHNSGCAPVLPTLANLHGI
jgi:hypothetical protein